LRAWALEVAERARSTREASGVTCNHAAEVEQVQQALTEVEAELNGLRVAMQTRAVIEQAKGMLMAQRGIDADAAFDVLVNLSQTTHRKLVEVASVLVDTWKAPPHGAS
jgi:AmiR/NasT family two-component response regulator